VIFGPQPRRDGSHPDKVARLLGLHLEFRDDETVDVLIVAAARGVAAGVYAGARVCARWCGGHRHRRPGRDLQPHRKLHGLPKRHLCCGPVWRGEVQR